MSGKKRDAHATALEELTKVIDALIAPDGCPWDQEQTPLSMCDYLAEETFELIEAIRSGDMRETMEELGDTLFILLFMAIRFEETGSFTLADALNASKAKMIRRHPHVFSEANFANMDELYDNWERTKREEKDDERKRVYDSLPKGLPPLLKAYRIHSKAARNKFTWDSDEAAESQLREEWQEWQDAMASGDKDASEREFGDYLFTLVELGRRKGIKANSALALANSKFLCRFGQLEELAEMRGLNLSDLSPEELNRLWDDVKCME